MNDELKAGPELDARIATEVMGWRMSCGFWMKPGESDRDEWFSQVLDWRPSTDIADAWRVIEMFALKMINVSVYTTVPLAEPDTQVWGASIFGCSVHAATAPLAICRTALIAMTYINAVNNTAEKWNARLADIEDRDA